MTGCPETSVRNYRYSLCSNPEERISVQCEYVEVVKTTSMYSHWTECVILAKYWLWLPDDGFIVNRNMLEQPS
jgi:hypothetical protein